MRPKTPDYTAKLRQEGIALGGPIPATVVRATQFHEFAVQILRRTRRDDGARAEHARGSVAARSAAEVPVERLEARRLGRAPDLGRPARG